MRKYISAVLGCGLVLCLTGSAFADDFSITVDMAIGDSYTEDHNDGLPWGGAVDVSVTNNGTEAWGDFHFCITEVPGLSTDISNVHFDESTTILSSQSPVTAVIDNDAVGATLDLFFYGDPVAPGDTVTFTVYTDNIDQEDWFGICMWPTPVPEPASFLLLGLGAVLIRRSR